MKVTTLVSVPNPAPSTFKLLATIRNRRRFNYHVHLICSVPDLFSHICRLCQFHMLDIVLEIAVKGINQTFISGYSDNDFLCSSVTILFPRLIYSMHSCYKSFIILFIYEGQSDQRQLIIHCYLMLTLRNYFR